MEARDPKPSSAGRGHEEGKYKSWEEQAARTGQCGNAGAACPPISPAGLDRKEQAEENASAAQPRTVERH